MSTGTTPRTVVSANISMNEERRPRECAVERPCQRFESCLLPAVVVLVSLRSGLSLAMDYVEASYRMRSSLET